MPREIPEWIGKNDNSPIPDRVRLRVFEKYHGRCYRSGVRLLPGMWDIDHITAVINGGKNRESNLAPIWKEKPHKDKTREDLKIKAVTYRKKKAYLGFKKKSRPMPGSKRSGFKIKMDGMVVKR